MKRSSKKNSSDPLRLEVVLEGGEHIGSIRIHPWRKLLDARSKAERASWSTRLPQRWVFLLAAPAATTATTPEAEAQSPQVQSRIPSAAVNS